ncbi:MAG: hypothetical protein BGP25_00150 [Lysobacterales bacterium 63-13]|nr:MAG: hypothetical protein BGP25_00150 [Xanthomonadales bacterium 63-13]
MGDADRPVALVTGGTHRVGASISTSLHGTHDLIVHSRVPNPRATEFVDGLNRRRPASARLVTADLDSAGALYRLAAEVGPRLDVLIHNASRFDSCGDTFDAAWAESLTRHMATNVAAPVLLTHALEDALRTTAARCQHPTLVVWLLDTRADGVFPKHSAYSLSRAAGGAAVQTLAHNLAPDVRVVGIAPGTVLHSDRPLKAISEETQKNQALTGPYGAPADIVRAIEFARTAHFLNATIISVDGGRSRWRT